MVSGLSLPAFKPFNDYVRRKMENIDFPIALEHKFYESRQRAQQNMSSQRLDRHKLASCICRATIETKPLLGKRIAKNANLNIRNLDAVHFLIQSQHDLINLCHRILIGNVKICSVFLRIRKSDSCLF